MSFVFYATRTSGTVSSFDQILEFAAIRTDADFVELERFEAKSRLLPHVVASPSSLFALRYDISALNDTSRPSHYQMARNIRESLIAWTPSTFVGFNSLTSDEHFLRQCLYQTLHPPYLTNCDGNTRADVAKVVQASLLFAPDAVTIPQSADGAYDIDLCAVASANGHAYNMACTAVASAEAIIELARLLNNKAPDLWSTAMRFSKKAAVVDFIENEPIFSISDFFYGKPHSWLVVLIGANSANSSERYVFNLRVDPNELSELTDEELGLRVRASPKPVRVLKINSVPILTTEDEAPVNAAGRHLDSNELNRRANVVQTDKELCERLIQAFEMSQTQKAKSAHVEEQLYDGFSSDSDLQLMEQFHTVPWERRASIVSRFKDLRLKRLGRRLIHFEKPDALDPVIRRQHDQAVAARLLGTHDDSPWLTLPKAMNELNDLIAAVALKDRPFLHRHRAELAAQIEHVQVQLGA